MSARERIEAEAKAQGFTARTKGFTYGCVEFRRRSRYVFVYFDVNGRVISASRGTGMKCSNFMGTGKAEQILAELAR